MYGDARKIFEFVGLKASSRLKKKKRRHIHIARERTLEAGFHICVVFGFSRELCPPRLLMLTSMYDLVLRTSIKIQNKPLISAIIFAIRSPLAQIGISNFEMNLKKWTLIDVIYACFGRSKKSKLKSYYKGF